jgi:hypothetical protein
MNRKKLLARLSRGQLCNVAFSDIVDLVRGFGFEIVRIRGSHHIFHRPGVSEMLNLQEVNGGAKPYQVRQLLRIVERHDLRLEEEA